jgi:hypothetical protein
MLILLGPVFRPAGKTQLYDFRADLKVGPYAV